MPRPGKDPNTDRQRRIKGSGTIAHDPKRGYYAQISRIEGGRRVRRSSKYFATKAEAQRALDDLERAEKNKAETRETVRGVVEAYIGRSDGRAREATTLQRYRGLAKNLDSINDLRVDKLSGARIEDFYAHLRAENLAPTTVFHVHSLLAAAMKWAARRGIIAANPFDRYYVEAPKRAKSEVTALTVADARKFIGELHRTRYAAALLFALATGMRRGELVGLRKTSLDVDSEKVLVRESRYQIVGEVGQKRTKSQRQREVPLNALALTALKGEDARQARLREIAADAWEESDFVFVDDFGRPLAPLALTNAFRVVAKAVGMYHRYSLHSLRHTAATWMLAGGMEIHAVQRVLGHTEASTTANVYGHVVDGRMRKAVEKIADVLGTVELADDLASARARKSGERRSKDCKRTA